MKYLALLFLLFHIYIPWITTPKEITIDVTEVNGLDNTFVYAVDYVEIEGVIYFGWWSDLLNGCTIEDGICNILVDDDLFAGGRDGWAFITSINLETCEILMADEFLEDDGRSLYEITLDFQDNPIVIPGSVLE